jgi:hypothetical protein
MTETPTPSASAEIREAVREETARQGYVHGHPEYHHSWYRRLKAALLCRQGHDPYLVETPSWFPFLFPLVTVYCARCGQSLKPAK